MEAHDKMAAIYLQDWMKKRLYASCYRFAGRVLGWGDGVGGGGGMGGVIGGLWGTGQD